MLEFTVALAALAAFAGVLCVFYSQHIHCDRIHCPSDVTHSMDCLTLSKPTAYLFSWLTSYLAYDKMWLNIY